MPPRAAGSSASIPSRTPSDTWSQILSGCPSDTDSLVNSRLRIFFGLPHGTAYVSLVVVAIATTAKYVLHQGSGWWGCGARACGAMRACGEVLDARSRLQRDGETTMKLR